MYEKGLVGLGRTICPWFVTADVGLLVAMVMYDKGLVDWTGNRDCEMIFQIPVFVLCSLGDPVS